jgi:zona occludens toxin
MLTLITGVPGAGKTAGAVDLLLREYGNRPLYVDGLNGLQIDHTEVDVLKWTEDVPDGAVVVVDEVQRKWRPRGPGSKVPDSVAGLETHRHRGLDFILITQNPRLLDANVRALIGRHVHFRDTGWAGRWAYEWPECSVECAWKTCTNKRKYKLPKRVFDLYKSASMHMKPVRKVPLMLWFLGLAVIVMAWLLWRVWGNFKGSEAPPLPTPSKVVATAPVQSLSGDGIVQAGWIDDRVAFIPRISSKPETAPAYDAIRSVVNMPLVHGGLCMRGRCVCVTQQGTDAGLSTAECKEWLDRPPFDPYTAQQRQREEPRPIQQASLETPTPARRTGPVE